MQPTPRELVNKFASAFAGVKVGFSAQQITDYFTRFSNSVTPIEHYGTSPSRFNLFIDSIYALNPKNQYYALNDLAFYEQESKYPYPNESDRLILIEQLHSFISPEPIGILFSKIRETSFREDWITAQSRIASNPSASITATRTMIETIMKTIISERNEKPNTSGDLQKLFGQVQSVLKFNKATQQAEHQIIQGMVSIIIGCASISNSAGDRHGTIGGTSIDDEYMANLVLNSAGTLGLAIIEMHLLSPMPNIVQATATQVNS